MRYNKGIYQERSLPMYPLIRRYLRRVDVVYLLLCAACSAISVVVLLSIGQTQLGSNNKASVQLIASLLGLMLAVVFSTADYHALARAWPLHGVVAWGLVLPTLFLHNVNTGLVTIGYDAGGTSNYSWYRPRLPYAKSNSLRLPSMSPICTGTVFSDCASASATTTGRPVPGPL